MKNKTLFILHVPPPVHGAAVVGQYVKNSQQVTSAFDARFINLGTSNSLEEIGRTSIRKLLRYLSLIFSVIKHLILFKPQVSYITPTATGAGFYKDVPLIALAKLIGKRTLLHYHNKGVSTRQNHFLDNLLYRFVFRNSFVILLSKHLYPDIQKYVPAEKVFYCPNGIPDFSRFIESTQEFQEHFSQRKPTEILFLSHLIRSKGVLLLVDACKLLKERATNFHCTLAGGDAELTKDEVERIIRNLGLERQIDVVGSKHGAEKDEVLKSTDIFIHPSYDDCFPLTLLEAMQYCLPIVSTCEGGIPDIVNDGITGFLVPKKDSKALADKLEILINDPGLRKEMGYAGRAKYEREFTLEKFEGRFVKILNEVATLEKPK